MFIDTHCHLTFKKLGVPDEVVAEASEAGVGAIISIGTDLKDSLAVVEISRRIDSVWAVVGIHPCDAIEGWRGDFKEIEGLCKEKGSNKIVGLGETGLDFYHKPFFKQRQADLFVANIECALENNLPVVVHMRDADDEVLKILEIYKNDLTGVVHCFSHKKFVAETVLSWGFYVGIGGVISYPKNDDLRATVKDIPLEKILLETDAPFLPPQEFRGKKNHPKYVPLIGGVLAIIKGVELSEVEAVTTENAKKLFGLTITE